MAKTVNFGVIYGLSAFGLASRLGITQSEAAAFIDAYFQEYAGVDRFITRTLEAAQAAGRVETILGRRRPISGIKSTTGRVRNLAERTAINTVIQGSAADLIKRAMILIDQSLREQGFQARMLLQIHDELVFEAPAAEIPKLAELVRRDMTRALDLKVPLKVDVCRRPQLARRRRGRAGPWLAIIVLESPKILTVTSGSHRRAARFSRESHGDPLQAPSRYRINQIAIVTDPLQHDITRHHAGPRLVRTSLTLREVLDERHRREHPQGTHLV